MAVCDYPKKVEYLSAATASNAVWLHQVANPHCTSIQAYQCDDHWHIGHASWWTRKACLQHKNEGRS